MSDFGCYCEVGGGDPPDFFCERIVRARKEHKCCECKDTIAPGQWYEIASGKWDGDFNAYKTCSFCARMRIALVNLPPSDPSDRFSYRPFDEGICFGGLGCAMLGYVHIDPIPEDQWIKNRTA